MKDMKEVKKEIRRELKNLGFKIKIRSSFNSLDIYLMSGPVDFNSKDSITFEHAFYSIQKNGISLPKTGYTQDYVYNLYYENSANSILWNHFPEKYIGKAREVIDKLIEIEKDSEVEFYLFLGYDVKDYKVVK